MVQEKIDGKFIYGRMIEAAEFFGENAGDEPWN